VTPDQFRRTLSKKAPPAGLAVPLAALWWSAKGEWDKAHALVMDDASREAAWVHAYLHRVEGDLGNARYWYRQAGRDAATGAHAAEWEQIAGTILQTDGCLKP
jgi:hypothetical protein